MGTRIPRLLQKALSSFPWLRRNSGEHGESRRLLPKGASKRNTKNAQESDDFPYYTHSIGAEADHSPAIAVPIKDWPSPQGYHPDPLVPFIKYLMFFFNFIFFTLGFGLLCFGFWGLADKQSLMGEKIGNLGTDPMLIFVLVGLVVCVLSFSGCVGFIRENLCLLKFFFAAMVTLLVAQSVVALVVLCFHEQIQDSVKMTMMLAISRYQDDSDLQFLLDEIQLGMECCGVQSYEDWSVNLYFNCSSPGVNSCGVPYSCCIDPLQNGTVPNSQCGFGALSMSEAMASSLIYLGGCVPQLVLWINRRSWDMAALYLSLPATQLVCMVCAQRVISEIKIVKSLY
ncbi:tetraspanin-10 isoform X2 [Hyla sarda]|uniref:tetraspanin-10 isoform X2 n=1 Tax=Hyla sarda TaxID=327740 RepID=UPI0024C38557|nr:tetraspanin-10 isoform X2 [Hyla sarda]